MKWQKIKNKYQFFLLKILFLTKIIFRGEKMTFGANKAQHGAKLAETIFDPKCFLDHLFDHIWQF